MRAYKYDMGASAYLIEVCVLGLLVLSGSRGALIGFVLACAAVLLLEALGELGIVGPGLTAAYLLAHGMVESFYQCFFFWAVFALCGSGCAKGGAWYADTKGPENTDETISGAKRG